MTTPHSKKIHIMDNIAASVVCPQQDDLAGMLKKLHLFHSSRHYREIIVKATQDNLTHNDFLKTLLDTELANRHERAVERLVKEARFPSLKTIDAFDWNHPAHLPKALVFNAIKLDFVSKHENLIFLGPGGVGKTHLAISIGFAACQKEIKTLFTTAADMINRLVASQADHSLEKGLKKYTSPRLLIIDELGYLPLDKAGRDLFFQVISKRSELGSVVLTTNKAFKDWQEVFQDNAVATAIAERLIEHGELIKIEGSSYRVKKRKAKSLGLESLDSESNT